MDVEDLQLFKVTFDEAESNAPGWTGAKKKKNPTTEPTGTLKNESAFKCRYLLIEISQTSSLLKLLIGLQTMSVVWTRKPWPGDSLAVIISTDIMEHTKSICDKNILEARFLHSYS